jgi:hypothetical protein
MLRLLLVSIPVCCLAGGVIGFVCRGRIPLQLCLSALISIAYFGVLEWRIGSPGEWSWTYPIASAMYLFGPFLILFFAPTFFVSLAVGGCSREETVHE